MAQDTADWWFYHLTISGPAATVDAFAAAARGSGITPWQLDYAAIEEDIFAHAVSQPASRRKKLTVEGCRILARQFREKVEMRQARAAALVGQSMACPFDLHALLPVPEAILLLGPTHPTALSWLAAQWGITDPAAPSERARQGHDRPTAAGRPCGDRLQLLHPSRNAGRGGRSAGRALAGSTVCAAAPDAGLSRAGMDTIADRRTGLDGQAVSDGPSAGPPADGAETGEGDHPS
jgi:hypothetical protein